MQQNQPERRQTGERRNGDERRNWQCQLDFPYVDSHGTLVSAERRCTVERRVEYTEYVNGDRRSGIANPSGS